jgi:hypothetical protein
MVENSCNCSQHDEADSSGNSSEAGHRCGESSRGSAPTPGAGKAIVERALGFTLGASSDSFMSPTATMNAQHRWRPGACAQSSCSTSRLMMDFREPHSKLAPTNRLYRNRSPGIQHMERARRGSKTPVKRAESYLSSRSTNDRLAPEPFRCVTHDNLATKRKETRGGGGKWFTRSLSIGKRPERLSSN